jgi:hypothetical protein
LNNKQVHGGNVWSVIAQEGPPFLAGWPSSFNHVLGDARLRDFKPELERFAVDVRRALKWVLGAHPSNQRAQLRLDWWLPSPAARFPTPIALAVPTQEQSRAE